MTSKKVSGNDMLRITKELHGSIDNAAQRLAVSWSAEEIIRASGRTPGCTCLELAADIKVHPDVAYGLAAKSPDQLAAERGVTAIAAQYGGNIPLYALGKVLGPWDSLLQELIPRRRR